MICYASHTFTKRNLAALRAAGWRLMISRASRIEPEIAREAPRLANWKPFIKRAGAA